MTVYANLRKSLIKMCEAGNVTEVIENHVIFMDLKSLMKRSGERNCTKL